MTDRRAVIAIGGNALIRDGQLGSIDEQSENARTVAIEIADLVAEGWQVVLTHGNGPQVGFIFLRSELVGDSARVPRLSLEMSGADSQGGIGHILGLALLGELARRGQPDRVSVVLTHTVVDPDDPAFASPSKPIGPWYSESEADVRRERDGWAMVEDSGRGYRRVVASPRPIRIVEFAQIRTLFDAGSVVIAVGGGGIPVVEDGRGEYRGVEAVIDKDRASALLAEGLRVSLFVLLTGVERVSIHYRRPDERQLDRLTVTEAKRLLAKGEFDAGSMGPKIEAACRFVETAGGTAVIGSLSRLREAVLGSSGTRVVPDDTGAGSASVAAELMSAEATA